MRTHPNVKFSRPDGFWKPIGVDDSSAEVQKPHNDDRPQSRKLDGVVKSVGDDEVDDRHDAAHTETGEHTWKNNILGAMQFNSG